MTLRSSKLLLLLLILSISAFWVPPNLEAQVRRGGPVGPADPTAPPPAGPYFDPTQIETMRGELIAPEGEWERWGHGNFTGGGLHFQLATGDGAIYELMLGPAWFLADQGITLHEGDLVRVTGSRVDSYGDQPWMQGPHGPGNGSNHGPHGPGNGPPGGDPGERPGRAGDFFVVTRLEVGGSALDLRDDRGYPLWRGGPVDAMAPWFDPDTTAHFRGVLLESLGFWSPWGFGNHTGSGMHYLFVGEDNETFVAILGPWWYLDRQGRVPEAGQSVEISGSVVDPYWSAYNEHRFLIATEMVLDGATLALRDEEGYPLWRGTGWHYYAPEYNPASEVRVSGTVLRTHSVSHGNYRDPGYEVTMLVEDGLPGMSHPDRWVLFVAPRWHLEERGFGLRAGEHIEVRGSLGRDFLGRSSLVVRTLHLGHRTWGFRSEEGLPMWMRGALP